MKSNHSNQTKKDFAALQEIIDYLDEGIVYSDENGIIRIFNKSQGKLDQTTSEKMLGLPISTAYNSELHTKVAKTKLPTNNILHTYQLTNGKNVTIYGKSTPLWIDGEFRGVFSICRSIELSKSITQQILLDQAKQESNKTNRSNGTRYTIDSIIGNSSEMIQAKKKLKNMALSESPVLIYGETGTGKELFAQGIHNASLHNESPFVAVNCTAIPENLLESTLFGTEKGSFTGAERSIGLLEQAGDGTFFLDEINSMPLSMQPKLLRALQERKIRRVGGNREIPIRCRIISSCNVPPERCVESGILRIDLFYRLAVLRIDVPPLRERTADIRLLAEHFINKYRENYGGADMEITKEFYYFLEQKDWPGNVRELEYTIERCLASANFGEKIPGTSGSKSDPEELSAEPPMEITDEVKETSLHDILTKAEKDTIEKTLKRYQGNISQSAKALGISRQNLQYRIRKLGISTKEK